MGYELRRLRQRRETRKHLDDLSSRESTVLAVHYSCESFYDRPEGRTARITSIAVRNIASGQTESFSIHKVAEEKGIAFSDIDAKYDELEREMLDEFFEYVRSHQGHVWMHWNMRDVNYGFQAIEHRFKVLGGTPVTIEESSKFDLARAIVGLYGVHYIGHPRLQNLIKKNRITDRDVLSGPEEAAAFDHKQYVKLHQSTLRKVDIIANIFERAVDRSLKTDARWHEIYGASPKVVAEIVQEHWIFVLLTLLGTILSIIAGVKLFF
jgi:hypothetical protein